MLFVVGVALAIAVGKLAGGRADRLVGSGLRWLWAALIALALQTLAVYAPRELVGPAIAPLVVGSQLVLLVVGLRNLRMAGAAIATLGIAMNVAVMLANGGSMPVAPETLAWSGHAEPEAIVAGARYSKDVVLPADQTRLEPLADRYWTHLPWPLDRLFSLGDVGLMGGVAFLIVRGMTRPIPISSEDLDELQRPVQSRRPETAAAG